MMQSIPGSIASKSALSADAAWVLFFSWMIWLRMLSAISAGVTAPIGRPMGAKMLLICSCENPALLKFAKVDATFLRLPIIPRYRYWVGRMVLTHCRSAL